MLSGISNPYRIFLLLTLLLTGIFTGCGKKETSDEIRHTDRLISRLLTLAWNSKEYLATVDSLQNYSVRTENKFGLAKAYSFRGSYFFRAGDYKKALQRFSDAAAIFEEMGNEVEYSDEVEKMGYVQLRLEDRSGAIESFKKTAEMRRALGDSTGLGASLNDIGFVYWQATNYDSAVVYFDKALSIRNELPNIDHRASTLNNLGTVYFNWALFDKALEYYIRALELQKEIKNDYAIAIALCNIGLIYKETSQREEAISNFREGLRYAYAAQDTQIVGYAYYCLGDAFDSTAVDSSFYYFFKALEAYTIGKAVEGQIICFKGIGLTYLEIKNYSAAENYFRQMLNLAISKNILLRIAEAEKGLGDVNLGIKNYPAAISHTKTALDLANEYNYKSVIRDASKTLSEAYRESGKTADALRELENHLRYKEEIENEEMQKRLSGLKNKFTFQKYEKDLEEQRFENERQKIYLGGAILILLILAVTSLFLLRFNKKLHKINLLLEDKNVLIKGQADELERKNNELQESNDAKDKLFSIIAHDLRSPFQVLTGISTLLREDYYELSTEERLEFIKNMDTTANRTYDLVENLLHLSASRTGKLAINPQVLHPGEIIDNIISLYEIQISNKNLVVKNNIKDDVGVIADKQTFQILIRNLLNNAIKYSLPGGLIFFNACNHNEDGNICLSVEDTGTGMDDELSKSIFNINKIKSRKGTEGEKGTGLGLGLCRELVEKQGGRIWVESKINEGSKFRFTLPSAAGK
ncbi:MAG: tetratricopeptide repeat protein [Ignavibacteriaceae bacterium]|nr:tetratricopeptide repeat protein [Ignavibacteriaceae bacterium]